MRYKKELLQLNVEKFTLEDVVEFLKFDTFDCIIMSKTGGNF